MQSRPGQTQNQGAAVGLIWVAAAIALRSSAAFSGKQAALVSRGGALVDLAWNPWYGLMLVVLLAQSVAWLLALRRLPLSYSYPFMSLVLVINLAGARWLFGESVGFGQITGIAIIIAGVVLVALGGAESSKAPGST
jgi:drug/metabolite transporter (DMT)-like permease